MHRVYEVLNALIYLFVVTNTQKFFMFIFATREDYYKDFLLQEHAMSGTRVATIGNNLLLFVQTV